jgi:hypothetical protein
LLQPHEVVVMLGRPEKTSAVVQFLQPKTGIKRGLRGILVTGDATIV